MCAYCPACHRLHPHSPATRAKPSVHPHPPQVNPLPQRRARGTGAAVGAEAEWSNIRTLLLYGAADSVQAALKTAQRLDQPPTQIRIEVMVTDISRNSLKELGLDYNWSKFGIQEIVRPNEQQSIANQTPLTPPDKSRFWRTPISIEATLKAMEQRGVAKLLANPSVSVLNGEMARVLIGDRILYPVVSGTTTAGTPLFDVREQEVGIVLQVRAYAEPGGTITLDIYPQVSLVTGFLRVGDSSLPQIATRELRTKIRVRDGSPIALGGLIRDEEVRTLQQVPLLSRIPVLGELFKSRRRSTTQNELVILLKPEVIRE
jgi:general secretion pathway protein D